MKYGTLSYIYCELVLLLMKQELLLYSKQKNNFGNVSTTLTICWPCKHNLTATTTTITNNTITTSTIYVRI